jgi:predicted permease
VFGNSNSLPISLVISLSQTLKGLHWDKIPGDNDDEVAARGILYLLIFQQLGQLLRWSWGYHVLLAPPEKYEEEVEHQNSQIEQGRYRDDPDEGSSDTHVDERSPGQYGSSDFRSGDQTPITHRRFSSTGSSTASLQKQHDVTKPLLDIPATTGANGNVLPPPGSDEHIISFPSIRSGRADSEGEVPTGAKGVLVRTKRSIKRGTNKVAAFISAKSRALYNSLPKPVQKTLSVFYRGLVRFLCGLWAFMNPPLWAMLVAIVVASVPKLQHLFYDEGSFIANSATRAISQSGGVAVPLILVVLGANLARNTLPQEQNSVEDNKDEKKMLIACLISRMLLPTIVMAPILALIAKYVPISILDDPIFVIVCFLLTGAPSALQLAQICQINGVYMGVMSKLLFQSYVVW